MIYRLLPEMSCLSRRIVVLLFLVIFQVQGYAQDESAEGKPQRKTLIIGSEQDFPPFATGMTDATAGGFTVELWRAVAVESGLDYNLRVLPFHQILEEFKQGRVDVLINLAQSDERHEIADFTVPHVIVNGAIFVRDADSNIRSEDDLAAKQVIVLNGDLAHDYALSKGWHLVPVDAAAEGMKLLASGQHDAMLLSKLTGLQTLQTLGLKNVRALKDHVGFSQKFSFAVHEGESELLGRINEGLALTKSNGTYGRLYEKWFGIYADRETGLGDFIKYIVLFSLLLLGAGGYFYYQRQQERRKAESKYRRLVMGLHVGVLIQSSTTEMLLCNQSALEMLGLTEQQLLGKSSFDSDWNVIHEDGSDFPGAEHPVPVAIATRKEVSDVVMGVYRPLTSDRVWLLVSARPELTREGEVKQVICTFTDISARKYAQQALSEGKAFNIAVLNSLSAHIAVIDQQGYIIAVNRAWQDFASVHGVMSLSSIGMGENYLDVCARTAYGAEALTGIKRVLMGSQPDWSHEYPCHLDGEQCWFKMTVTPLQSSSGGAVISHENITDRKISERKLHDLTAHLQTIREEEKNGIAREIHDELGGTMTALKIETHRLKLEMLRHENSALCIEQLESMSSLINNAAGITRRIISDLRPTILDDLGLLAAIEWEAERFHKRTGIESLVNCIGDRGNLDTPHSIALFRILQEALTNVSRHAQASCVEIEFHHSDDEVLLSVSDNGCGLSYPVRQGAHGMLGMKERAEQLGGVIRFDVPPGGGLCVMVTFSLEKQERRDH